MPRTKQQRKNRTDRKEAIRMLNWLESWIRCDEPHFDLKQRLTEWAGTEVELVRSGYCIEAASFGGVGMTTKQVKMFQVWLGYGK
jgi:hypothetical protein